MKNPVRVCKFSVAQITENTDLIVRRWLENDFYVANFNATYKKEDIRNYLWFIIQSTIQKIILEK